MFPMTSMIQSNTGATQDLLYKILGQLQHRGNMNLMNSNIVVPSNCLTAENTFNNGKYAVLTIYHVQKCMPLVVTPL